MAIDMSQFLETFYEESFEGLEVMESSLLNLDPGTADDEVINTIFRAAHSIKGGSGTFGLNEVAEFTHVMETLLDEMRDGRRDVTKEGVAVLLTSVDVLREMLSALRAKEDIDIESAAATKNELDNLLAGASGQVMVNDGTSVADDNSSGTSTVEGWEILFKPYESFLMTGNDPIRIFKELKGLGDLDVFVDPVNLPGLNNLNPEDCHLSWKIILKGNVPEDVVNEAFVWVEDDCDLDIKAIGASLDKLEDIGNTSSVESYEGKSSSEVDKLVPVRKTPSTKKAVKTAESNSIRVSIDKVDDLINMMGELVITQSMLSQLGESEDFEDSTIERLRDGLSQLERNTREMQENVMRIRMLPISFAFQRFPRLVHDLSGKLDKSIELKMTGENTELDKTVMEKIGDPLVHLVRNSIDHGIESREDRIKAGKPEAGIINLNAFHEGGNIIIEIIDDGAGINKARVMKKARENKVIGEEEELTDEQIYDLIFSPGFSTAEEVSDISGRGVGMDVVRRNIRALGGSVDVHSTEGVGSTFRIRLPLTLAILDGQSVQVGDNIYIIPLISIIESLQVKKESIKGVTGRAQVYKLRDEYIPIVRLHEIFGVKPESNNIEEGLLVVVEGEGNKIALYVDDLLGQQQVVIKSLETNFKKVEGISGATILGDGTVALILDIVGLVYLYRCNSTGNTKNVGNSEIAA
ncbi:Signal transduction histidine kinase CheA [hydrothermal vent metagenome]|uniref:Chemotaxis protein CheA n=1 Tax=hydrothermal vent metagenome TaxID=652676 RepID=A0A3B1B033_9ZZZZ